MTKEGTLQKGKGVTLSFFADTVILYVKDLKNFTRDLKMMKTSEKCQGIKINLEKLKAL